MICDQPQGVSPPRFRFFLEETYTAFTDPPVTRLLPTLSGGGFLDGFIQLNNIEDFTGSFNLGIEGTSSSLGPKTLKLKECFPPVLIRWKHYTHAAVSGDITSTDEEVLLDRASPDYTWPRGTERVQDVTDGESDGDFEMHQTC